MFGFGRKKGENAPANNMNASANNANVEQQGWNQPANNWADLQQVPFAGERQQSGEDLVRDQENKVIAYFLGGNDERVFKPGAQVASTPEMREEFMRELKNNEIDRDAEQDMLMQIMRPTDIAPNAGIDRAWDKISKDPDQMQAFVWVSNMNVVKSRIMPVDEFAQYALRDFTRKFETPLDFEDARAQYIESHSNGDEEEQRRAIAGMYGLQKNMFGDRFDYYLRFENLRDEVRKAQEAEAAAEKAREFARESGVWFH